MIQQVKEHLGDARLVHLVRFFRGATVVDDMIELALIVARNRAITAAQRPIAAAISLLRRAGIKAPTDLLDAWESAGGSGTGPLPTDPPADVPSPKLKATRKAKA